MCIFNRNLIAFFRSNIQILFKYYSNIQIIFKFDAANNLFLFFLPLTEVYDNNGYRKEFLFQVREKA